MSVRMLETNIGLLFDVPRHRAKIPNDFYEAESQSNWVWLAQAAIQTHINRAIYLDPYSNAALVEQKKKEFEEFKQGYPEFLHWLSIFESKWQEITVLYLRTCCR
jgi:hypothetical protein